MKCVTQLQKFDIVKIIGRKDVIVVGKILGTYESSIMITKGKVIECSNPYSGCWAIQLLDSKSVVPIGSNLYDVEKIYRNGALIYGE